MEDNPLVTLRTVIKTLRELHKVIRQKRRELAQVVGDGVEIEMVSARVGFAIKQLSDARDLYAKLVHADDDEPNIENIELTLSERGHEIRRRTEEGE
jgi:hypothetical protein